MSYHRIRLSKRVYSVFCGTLLSGLVFLGVGFCCYKNQLIVYASRFSNFVASALPEKQINFESDSLNTGTGEIVSGIVPPEALKLLPFEDSGLSWFLKRTEIEETLQQDPTLLSASVKSCGIVPFLCFTVSLEQRVPVGFVVDPQNVIYLVGSDGGFVRKARKEDSELSLPTFVITRNDTSDVIRKKIQLLSRVAAKTKEKLSVMPSVIALKSSDIELSWKKLPLKIVLSSECMYENARLEQELERISFVLRMYKGREDQIQKIDATPSRVAVVSEIASISDSQYSKESHKPA